MNLPDINVLVAMSFQGHVHHSVAVEWHRRASKNDERWGLCRITSMGLLRLLTNSAVMGPDVLTPSNAWAVLEQLEFDPLYQYLEEPPECWEHFRKITRRADFAFRHWTDAYLAALSAASGTRIVTFDRRFTDWMDVRCTVLKP